jgi:hypothetical protein
MASHVLSANAGVSEQLLHECVAMSRYALASGMPVPPASLAAIETMRSARAGSIDIAALTRIHGQLCKLVAPATPRALLLMGDEHGARRFPMLGPVGIVRRMMIAAAISTVVFVLASLTKAVNVETLTVQTASGLNLFLMEAFWISAAGMGASFAMLMKVSGYVVQRNYDPKYESSYWIKFLLGLMAGFILVALVPIDEMKGSALPLARPTLAMLGGFSASAVYRILTRMVETVESLFSGDKRDEMANREAAVRTRLEGDASQTRLNLASRLVTLQHQVAAGASAEAVSSQLGDILSALVPDSVQANGTAPATAAAPAAAEPDASAAAPSGDDTGAPSDSQSNGASAPAASAAPDATDDAAPATVALPGVSVVSDAPAATVG